MGSVARLGRASRVFQRIDCKVGADRLAVVAVNAQLGLLDRGGMVSLGVEPRRKFQHVTWTVLDAIAAALAPVFYDVDNPLGNEDFFTIQGNPPEFHAQ